MKKQATPKATAKTLDQKLAGYKAKIERIEIEKQIQALRLKKKALR